MWIGLFVWGRRIYTFVTEYYVFLCCAWKQLHFITIRVFCDRWKPLSGTGPLTCSQSDVVCDVLRCNFVFRWEAQSEFEVCITRSVAGRWEHGLWQLIVRQAVIWPRVEVDQSVHWYLGEAAWLDANEEYDSCRLCLAQAAAFFSR